MARSIRLRDLYRWAALLACLSPLAANAACSRIMRIPVSPSGMTIRINNDDVGGMMPDLLRKFGKPIGCDWLFTPAPRARVEAMFEAGQGDLMLGSTRSARRDELGHFIPLVSTRATLVWLGNSFAPVRSLAELQRRTELRVALVRGQEYGEEFNAMVQVLTAQKRLIYESNPVNVARLIDGGLADLSIMTPIAMAGMMGQDPRYAAWVPLIHIAPVDELPWSDTGVYVSKGAVNAADRATLEKMFVAMVKSGDLWEQLKAHYPAELLRESVKIP